MRWLVIFASFFSLNAAASDKDDGPLQSAKEHVARADVAYEAHQYKEALDEYQAAYDSLQAPPLLFNIAQCQRLLGSYDAASLAYRSYLAQVPDSPYRAEVELHLKNLDEKKAAEQEEQARLADELARSKKLKRLLFISGGLAGVGAVCGVSALALNQGFVLAGEASSRQLALKTGLALSADALFLSAGVTLALGLKKNQAPTSTLTSSTKKE